MLHVWRVLALGESGSVPSVQTGKLGFPHLSDAESGRGGSLICGSLPVLTAVGPGIPGDRIPSGDPRIGQLGDRHGVAIGSALGLAADVCYLHCLMSRDDS
jgi:hypothetical protein